MQDMSLRCKNIKYRNTYEGFLDSLRFEDERLTTFIDLVDTVDVKELAKMGFII